MLHQLRRVEAGLRGVWLGGLVDEFGASTVATDAAAEPAEGTNGDFMDVDDTVQGSNDDRQTNDYETRIGTADAGAGTAEELGTYQEQLRDQGEKTVWGEIGGRTNAVRNRVAAPVVQSTSAGASFSGVGTGGKREAPSAGQGKEARKKAKKDRVKEEKARRASERMARDVAGEAGDAEVDVDGAGEGEGDEEAKEVGVTPGEKRRKDKKRKGGKNGGEDADAQDGDREVSPKVNDGEGARNVEVDAADGEQEERIQRKAEKRAKKQDKERKKTVQ